MTKLQLVEAPRPLVDLALDENDAALLLRALDGLSVSGVDGMEAVVTLAKKLRASLPK